VFVVLVALQAELLGELMGKKGKYLVQPLDPEGLVIDNVTVSQRETVDN
jgi:hypothetical protein